MRTVNKEMIIREVLALDPGTARIMMQFGLHCMGCPHASRESLEDAAVTHALDVDALVEALNAYLKEQEQGA